MVFRVTYIIIGWTVSNT